MKSRLLNICWITIILIGCKSETSKNKEISDKLDIKKNTIEQKSEEQDNTGFNLEIRKVLGRRIEILMPEIFFLMPDDMLEQKYPIREHRPTEVYTNTDGTVNVALNHTLNKSTSGDLINYKAVFERQFHKPMIEFKDSKIIKINDKDFIVLDFITPAMDNQKIYNLFFMTNLDDRLLMCTFNCTMENYEIWKDVCWDIVKSVKIIK